jgi:hypothetical protein
VEIAFQFNPWLILSLPLLAALAVTRWIRKSNGDRNGFPARWLWILGVLVLLVSLWRNLPGAPAILLPP